MRLIHAAIIESAPRLPRPVRRTGRGHQGARPCRNAGGLPDRRRNASVL